MRTFLVTVIRTVQCGIIAVLLVSCGGNETAPQTMRALQSASSSAVAAPSAAAYNELIQRIYLAYFGRPSDPAGLAYWSERYRVANLPGTVADVVQLYQSDAALRTLVDVFGQSQESRDLYSGDNDAFIRAIYLNLFSREPDPAGKAYWVQLLDSGAVTRPIAALTIMSGARSTDIIIVDKKAAAAALFTSSLDTPARAQSYDGLDANAIARGMLRQVVLGTTTEQMQSLVGNSLAELEARLPGTSVSSYSPSIARVMEATRFTFNGKNLPGGLAFSLEDCIGTSEAAGGTALSRSFTCTPLSSGTKRGTLRLASSGAVLANVEVTVMQDVAAAPVVDSYSPSVATVGERTTFTFTGSNLISGMGFTLADCTGVAEIVGGTSLQRQFACTPSSAGSKAGVIRDKPGGAGLGTFTVEVQAAPAVDWNSRASATEFFSSTNTLSNRKRSFVGNFTVAEGNTVADFVFVSQYTARVYIMPRGQGARFAGGLGFEYHASLNLPNDVNFVVSGRTIAPGEYDVGVENMTANTNTTRIEIQAPMKVEGFKVIAGPFPTHILSLRAGARQAQAFSVRNDKRILVDGANTGGDVYIISRDQEPNFYSGNQFYYYDKACASSGTAAPGFCELKLPPGEYAIAYHNSTTEQQTILFYGLTWGPE